MSSINDPAFQTALKFTLPSEGGISNNPADHGGLTNHGITVDTYNRYRMDNKLPIQSLHKLTSEEIEIIYHDYYWARSGCDDLPLRVAVAQFDWAVNHGVSGAMKDLQYIVHQASDGVYGPHTKEAVKVYLSSHNEEFLLQCLLIAREDWYRRFATGNQAQFLQGWLNRLGKLKTYLNTLPQGG